MPRLGRRRLSALEDVLGLEAHEVVLAHRLVLVHDPAGVPQKGPLQGVANAAALEKRGCSIRRSRYSRNASSASSEKV
jgi:hypothetical protein